MRSAPTLPPTESYGERLAALQGGLAALDDLAVAFSGGVDSSVLLHAAHAALGTRAVGVIADSPSLPRRELEEARRVARSIGARLIELRTEEFARKGYVRNDGLRCYWCKRTLFEDMRAWAGRAGVTRLAFGEITDDALDVRPGARAAREQGIVAPLREAGFSKSDVRRYARDAGLEVHDKPASACLASRIPLGTPVSRERLAVVEASEEALRNLGLRVLRVRDHGERARVELGLDDLELATAQEERVRALLREQGFGTVELALYRSPTAPGPQR